MTTWEMGGGWGDRIQWFDWKTRKLVGWKTPKPAVGDKVRAEMQSGRKALFTIISIEPTRNPSDMFFATVSDGDYEEETVTKIGA